MPGISGFVETITKWYGRREAHEDVFASTSKVPGSLAALLYGSKEAGSPCRGSGGDTSGASSRTYRLERNKSLFSHLSASYLIRGRRTDGCVFERGAVPLLRSSRGLETTLLLRRRWHKRRSIEVTRTERRVLDTRRASTQNEVFPPAAFLSVFPNPSGSDSCPGSGSGSVCGSVCGSGCVQLVIQFVV